MIYFCRVTDSKGEQRTEILTDLDQMPSDVVEYTVIRTMKN